ncbi:hypothetical protein [Variovorax sp. CCNWLW235]|uniref:hypothetical protein n=1 Tax=Variovorax sp. CCNWLW235 TaxID=3127463 RepID=UPI003077EE8E
MVAQHLQNYEISFCKQILEEGQGVATVNVSFWSHLAELIINSNREQIVNSNTKLLSELNLYMHQFGVVEIRLSSKSYRFLGALYAGRQRAEWPLAVDELVSERLDRAGPGGRGGGFTFQPASDN